MCWHMKYDSFAKNEKIDRCENDKKKILPTLSYHNTVPKTNYTSSSCLISGSYSICCNFFFEVFINLHLY